MDKSNLKLIPGNFYHIYNKANNPGIIFFKERNYYYFLEKFQKYLNYYLQVFAYCLLPDHFHFLVKIINDKKDQIAEHKKEETISKAFSNFFNSYSKSINVQENRFGNLFSRPFKRKFIKNQNYLTNIICYIHRNPLHHGIVSDFSNYKWSSYSKILNNENHFLESKSVLEWFGGKDEYILIHKELTDKYLENLEN